MTVDRCGKIVHVAFGYRFANDQLVLSLSNIFLLLPDDVKLCADGGFSSKKFGVHLVTPSDISNDEKLKHLQKVERVIVECTIGFIKRHEMLIAFSHGYLSPSCCSTHLFLVDKQIYGETSNTNTRVFYYPTRR